MTTWAANTYNWDTIPYAWDDEVFYPSAASLTLTGSIPVAARGVNRYPAVASLTMSSSVPDINRSFAPSIAAGTLTINGQTPVFAKGIFTSIPVGSLSMDLLKWSGATDTWAAISGTWADKGMSPIVGVTYTYDIDTGTFIFSSEAPTKVHKDPTYKPTVWIM
jgi:hypothetical protein